MNIILILLGWQELKLQRVRAKERAAGVDKNSNNNMRPQRLAEEEDLMLNEYQTYGAVMKIRPPGYFLNGQETFHAVNLPITSSNTNDNNGNNIGFIDVETMVVRPFGWNALREKRVHAKERAAGIDSITSDMLNERSKKEDENMKKELKNYGRVMTYGGPKENDFIFPSNDDNLNKELRDLNQLEITPENFDPEDRTKRPKNWNEIKKNRILVRESAAGVDPSTIDLMRQKRDDMEEDIMLSEILSYVPFHGAQGKLFDYGTPDEPFLEAAHLNINERTYDPNDQNKRPKGFF